MNDRIKFMQKILPEGNWRQFGKVEIMWTELVQCWHYNDQTYKIHHYCPWGMRGAIGKLLLAKKCKNFLTLPLYVKSAFKIDGAADYKADNMEVKVQNTGAQ